MDESKVQAIPAHHHAGAVIPCLQFGGATLRRILHPPRQAIAAHAHDWPVLSVYRLGAYLEQGECGRSVQFDGPSVVFHPAGSAHADQIGASGLETLSLSFDPDWLPKPTRCVLPAQTCWITGGTLMPLAGRLADALCAGRLSEAEVRARVGQFLLALHTSVAKPTSAPDWAPAVLAGLDEPEPAPTVELAHRLKLHPAWLARAWRHWRGEGLVDSLRRRRVERAVLLLRGSTTPLAQVAVDCGFCDQAHMNRCFRQVLGRTPLAVRGEAHLLAEIA